MNVILGWYQSLTASQQVWTWILIVLCVIGIVRLSWLCLHYWIIDYRFINTYLGAAFSFAKKFRDNINNSNEYIYLVQNREKATAILGNDRVSFPEIEIVSGIKHKTIYTYVTALDLADKLQVECLEWDQKRKRKRWHYLIQLIIPVFFWLFRGFESILQLIAYLLGELGWTFNEENKIKLISILGVLFTFITGLASLFSYIGFYPWK